MPLMIQGLRTNPKDPESHILCFDIEALIGMYHTFHQFIFYGLASSLMWLYLYMYVSVPVLRNDNTVISLYLYIYSGAYNANFPTRSLKLSLFLITF